MEQTNIFKVFTAVVVVQGAMMMVLTLTKEPERPREGQGSGLEILTGSTGKGSPYRAHETTPGVDKNLYTY